MQSTSTDAIPQVKHIVVVMFENRSFDNMLGWAYQSIRPSHFIPDTPMARYNGLQGLDPARYTNPVLTGSEVELFTPTRGFKTTTIDGVEYLLPPPVDPHEEFEHMTRQIYGPWNPNSPPIDDGNGNVPAGVKPKMDAFAADYATALGSNPSYDSISRVMETGTYSQTYPFGILAHAYAVSDAWYSSTPTQTNPNRAFMACGTSQGLTNNNSSGINIFTVPTIWNRLTTLNKTWKIYWENQFPPDGLGSKPWTRQCFSQLNTFGDEYFPRIGAFHRDARRGELPFFSFIEPSWTLEKKELGRLEGFQGNDLHPPGDIRPGLQFLSAIYSSLVSNQKAWANTLLLVTFDEHGGTYDHVPPPDNVMPDTAHPTGFRFNRVGPRVPTLLISPMVEPGTVFRSTKTSSAGLSFPYDHTSIPATILKLAGVSADHYGLFERTKVAPTFEGVLTRAANPRTDIELGHLSGDWNAENDPEANELICFGDVFRLRYRSTGHPCDGQYITGDSTTNGSNLRFTSNQSQAYPFRFALGYSGNPAIPDNQFVRTTGLVYIQIAASWPTDSRNESYLRVADTKFSVSDYCILGKDEGWWYSQWYVSNANRETLGWGLTWGSQVTLEYHALNSNTHWLPRKILPRETWHKFWVGVGQDADYANPNVGRWVIERV